MEKREAGRLLCDIMAGRKSAEAGLGKLSPAAWESLADRAMVFKVAALFYREIKSLGFPVEHVPEAVKNKLRTTYRNLATRNTNLFFAAAKALAALADQQLPVIALKGLALAKNIYGDIALRPMSDIDLLLREKDLVRAGRTLLALGYQQPYPDWESTIKAYHHLPPFTGQNGVVIELHWNIVPPDSPVKVDLDGLWARARQMEIAAVNVRVLSPEDLFLHLCVHAGFHLRSGLDLILLCDIARLIRTSAGKIDWRTVAERAGSWGCRKCAYLILLLVRELLAAAPPDELMSGIKPDDYRPVFLAEALERIFEEKPSGQLFKRRIGKLAKITAARGIAGKAAALLEGVFPAREYLARVYPVSVSSPKIYLLYLSRLRRLLGYFFSVFIRLFRRDPSVTHAFRHEQEASAVSDWMFS